MPALRLDAAIVHMNRADAAGNGQYLGPDPYFDDLFCLAAEQAYMSCEQIVPALYRAAAVAAGQPGHGARGQRGARRRALHRCVPDYGRDEEFQRRYAASAAEPAGLGGVPRAVPRRRRGRLPESRQAVRAERAEGRPEARGVEGTAPPARTCACWRAPGRGMATARSWPARWG